MKNKNKSSTVGKPLLYIAQANLELAAPKMKRVLLTNFENEDPKEQSKRNENIVSCAVEEMIKEEQLEEQQVENKIEEEQPEEQQVENKIEEEQPKGQQVENKIEGEQPEEQQVENKIEGEQPEEQQVENKIEEEQLEEQQVENKMEEEQLEEQQVENKMEAQLEEQQVENKIEEEQPERQQVENKMEEEQPEEQVKTVPHNRSFKDMNNDEKIHFLLNRPHYIPKVKCRIKTATVSYVGLIISYRNGIVSIMPPNSMRDIRLSIEDIESIDMAGL